MEIQDIYFGVTGLYRPSFFQMEINHEHPLNDIAKLPDHILETYLHEYVHFLQDISTTFGLTNACYVVEYMKFAAQEIRQSYGDTFPIPLPLKPSVQNKVYENTQLMQIYAGTSRMPVDNLIIEEIKNIKRTQVNIPISSTDFKLVPQIIVYYIDSNRQHRDFFFGATCIIENMAFLIERLCFKKDKFLSDIPYHAAEMIAYYQYEEFAKNPLNMLALCDVSLFSFNPGDLFVCALKEMKEKNWLPKTPLDIYAFCKEFFKLNYETARNIFELYEIQQKEAIKELGDYFTIDEFKDNKKWVELIIQKAAEFRQKQPSFIIDLAVNGNPRQNNIFAILIKEIGVPQITNAVGESYFYHKDAANYNFHPIFLLQLIKFLIF